MHSLLHARHPFRIFLVSAVISFASIGAVWWYLGPHAAFLAFVLMLVEITFSFDNAILNAKVLARMSAFWQQMFMTVGMLIAVFGMRLVFPVALVMVTTGLGAGSVADLALHHPGRYAEELDKAHPLISSFGGMFLLMLCLNFFFDAGRTLNWIDVIERPMQRLGSWWIYTVLCLGILLVCAAVPFNEHPKETVIAGIVGIISYLAISNLAELFGRSQPASVGATKAIVKQTGVAGFIAFIYLQILDASFSFDGVIGAFAVTQDVILIAIGLGIGALWVRSLTLFMVKRHVLHAYRYLEHGAHYTIGVLALVLLGGLFVHIPELVAGLSGIVIVAASVFSSVAAARADSEVQYAVAHR